MLKTLKDIPRMNTGITMTVVSGGMNYTVTALLTSLQKKKLLS